MRTLTLETDYTGRTVATEGESTVVSLPKGTVITDAGTRSTSGEGRVLNGVADGQWIEIPFFPYTVR